IDTERTLPDVLSFDPSKPAKYPNGRVFTDDVIDYRLASISTRNNSVNTIGVLGGSAMTQANWMISFLSPNQGIGVG
ncbi:MAG: hypothetical protein WAN08_07295, partial [Candidatus Sulfotelmatobacter sp.]